MPLWSRATIFSADQMRQVRRACPGGDFHSAGGAGFRLTACCPNPYSPTTICSSCAAPSAPSRRSPTSGPGAPIATLLYDEEGTHARFAGRPLRTSPLQRLGMRQGTFRAALPLFQSGRRAARRVRLRLRRLEQQRIRPRGTPTRRAPSTSATATLLSATPGTSKRSLSARSRGRCVPRSACCCAVIGPSTAARRAGSTSTSPTAALTRERIRRYWGRDAPVVHPPVEVDRFFIGEPADYVLFVGELVRHKRPEVAIEAASAAGRPIKMVGSGPELGRLQARYGRQAEFLGRVADEELARLYAGAAALVVPGVEEFGIAAVEAQASGRPVIAIDSGGCPGDRRPRAHRAVGAERRQQTPSSRRCRGTSPRSTRKDIRAHAEQFAPALFQARIREIVEATCR